MSRMRERIMKKLENRGRRAKQKKKGGGHFREAKGREEAVSKGQKESKKNKLEGRV